jgi:hypothetical protein
MAREKTDQEKHPENYFNSPVGHPRDRIILHESLEATKGGRFISLNGYAFWAQSGVEIDLPRPVRLMLDTLVRTETTRTDDGRGSYRIDTRDIRRFTYTLLKEDVPIEVPEAAVIDAQKPSMDASEKAS